MNEIGIFITSDNTLPPDIELSDDFLRLSSASTKFGGKPKKHKIVLL